VVAGLSTTDQPIRHQPVLPSASNQEDTQVIVQGPAGRHAYSVGEKEVLLRFALTAPHTPWVTTFRIGATCARGRTIAWFPCSLLVSAVHGSDHVALEYRSWRPDTLPRFDTRDPHERFADLITDQSPGTWITHHDRPATDDQPLFLRDSRVLWDDDNHTEIQADPIHFPHTAPIPALKAARAIRTFCRTGQRPHHVSWTTHPVQVVSTPVAEVPTLLQESGTS
jgi:hypothetical protein